MEELGDVFFFRAVHLCVVNIADSELAKQVMSKLNLPKARYHAIEELVGKSSLLTSNGENWSWKRKMMNPAFHHNFLKNILVSVVTDVTQTVFENEFNSAALSGDPVDIQEWFTKITLDVIGLAGFDYPFGFTKPSTKKSSSISEMILTVLSEPGLRLSDPLRKYTHFKQSREYDSQLKLFKALGRQIIQAARDADVGGEDRSILSLLLKARGDDGLGMTDDNLLDEIMTFLVAGHETTSGTLSFLIYLLAKHPEVKNKVYAEVDEIMGERTVPTFEDQNKVTYGNYVIKETLRLFPVAPGTSRAASEDMQIGKHVIPKDALILVNFYLMHRNPKYWKNPLQFIPERFDTNSSEGENPMNSSHIYIPFAAGPRICIGKPFAEIELRLILLMFCRNYDFEIVEEEAKDNLPFHHRFTSSVTMRPLGYKLRLTKRV
ncbi:cytochrome P450 [Paraphysoderma sedebokerense]|nr:cytochrome P450 [Paraphysoderma sedebokerense]